MTESTEPTANLEQAAPPETTQETTTDSAETSPERTDWSARLDEALKANSSRQEAKTVEEPEPEDAPEEPASPEEKVSWDEVISTQPPDVQRLMKQLRAESTRRFQEGAELKRQAQADRDALFNSDTFKQLRDMAGQEGEVDVFDPKSLDAFIERKVAQRLESVLAPVQKAHQSSIAQQKYEQYMSDHPELKTDTALRAAVASELRSNSALSLDQAHLIVRGRRAQTNARQQEGRRKAERRAARAAALKVSAPPSRGGSQSSPDLAGKSGADIYAALLRLRQTAD